MDSQITPHQQLIEAIPHLSDQQVILLLQWIQSLQTKPVASLADPIVDPLAQFVGASTHSHLASVIDETLYG